MGATVESRVRSPATTIPFVHWWWLVVGVALGFGAFALTPAGAEGAPGTAAYVGRIAIIPTVLAGLTMVGFAGIGALVLERAFPDLGTRQTTSARLLSGCITGMAVVSLGLLVIAALGGLDLLPFALARAVLVGVGLWFGVGEVRRMRRTRLRPDPIVEVLLCLFVAVGTLLLCGLIAVTSIHPDARQYHAAIPRSYRLDGGLVANDTLLLDGAYLGFDLLYLVTADLARLTDHPLEVLRQLAAFSFFAEALLLAGTYCLARSLGASRRWATVAAAAMFTVSSIGRWGTVKNDLIVAGAAVVAAALIVDALHDVTEDRLAVAGMAVGFALSVKVSIGAGLGLLIVYAAMRVIRAPGLRLRAKLLPAALAGAFVLPWMLRAVILRGNPIYPLAVQWPDRIAEGWAARNANGLELTLPNLLRYWPDLMLDRYEVSGNESIGILFLVALTVGVGLVAWHALRRRVTPADMVFVSGVVYLAIFTFEMFEGRFLLRYVLFAAATTFAFAVAAVSTWLARNAVRVDSLLAVAAIGIVVALSWDAGLAQTLRARADDAGLVAYATGAIDRAELDTRMEALADVPLNRIVNALAEDGSVLINDHFFLFLDSKPVNVHPLHSTVFDFDELDVREFAREMQSRSVTAAVIRGDQSLDPVVEEYLARCGDPVGTIGMLTAYSIRPECRDGGRPLDP